MEAPFIVTSETSSNIIGMNVIRTYKLKMDVPTTTVTASLAHVASLQTSEEYDVKVHTDINVEAGMSHLTKLFLADKKSGKRLFRKHQFMVTVGSLAVATVSDRNRVFELLIPNSTNSDIQYKRNDHIGEADLLLNWTPIAKSEMVNWTEQGAAKVSINMQQRDRHNRRPHTAEDTEKMKHALDNRNREANIPYVKRPKYHQMLYSMLAAFSADEIDLGRTNIVESYIDLRYKEPVYTQQFRLPMEQIKFIKENVMGWLDAGIVKRANLLYNSPIFCVPKKQGHGLRCVLHFRRLNLKTLNSKYSICCIDQCLEEVCKAGLKIFSCLDMWNGPWNQVLRETDRHFTAFTIPGIGQMLWTVTAQGLCGVPAAFSRLMDTIMEGASNIITFVDNVLINSATHEAHIAHLRPAIQRTHKAGLVLNPNKCIFGSTTVEYLGHTISSDGVRPGKDKTQAVKEITEPKTMKQLKSFIGLANYFRSYVKGFARVAGNLHPLTKQNTKWKEVDGLPRRSKEAFKAIKAAISSRPVMAYPNNNGRFHLYVNAALGNSKDEGGLGAALWQEDEHGIKQIIGYASRRLTASEKNYSAFVTKMQAAVYGMTYFQHYLVTRKFTLYTDHKPLCKLNSTHVKTLSRLQLKMTELSPLIRYIEGKNNTVVDFLSRYHKLGAEEKKTEVREYSSKHQGLGIAQVNASTPRIRALLLLDNNLEPMI
jgi:hypothetical protein